LPLVALPYAWYTIVLWYSNIWAFDHAQQPSNAPRTTHAAQLLWRPSLHRLGFGLLTLLFVTLIMLLSFTRLLPSFSQVLTLDFSAALTLAGFPLLLLYPIYIIVCMALALTALLAPAPLHYPQQNEARQRARPWLIATTGDLLLVSLAVAALMLWLFAQARPVALWPGIPNSQVDDPINLIIVGADLTIAALLLLAIGLMGQAIVSYEIFSGRVLPRAALRRHWRNALFLAAGYGSLASTSLSFSLPPIYLLLLTASLITLFYVLLGWRTFHHHEELMRRLRPFVRSQHLYEQVTATAPLDEEANRTFAALCTQVLKTHYAALSACGALAPLMQPPLVFPNHAPPPDPLLALVQPLNLAQVLAIRLEPHPTEPARYAIPLWNERGLSGLLFLGAKYDDGLYTQEELEVAQAVGERLIDTRVSLAIAQRLFTLQRQRLAESQVLDRQTRRTLHDEILPQLHTALLTLSQGYGALEPVQSQLAAIHRQISDLLRNQQPAAHPSLPAEGLLSALQRLLDEEIGGIFDEVRYQVEETAKTVAASLTDLEGEVLYYALREVVRNAARHGRGGNEQRALHLQVTVSTGGAGTGLRFCVADDGVGLAEPASLEQGRGLTLHRTLLAILGATLEVCGKPNAGVTVQITWRR
jgi:signal transduction histidine kinase